MRILTVVLLLLWTLPAAAQPRELTFGADAKSNAPFAFADPADNARLIGFEKEIIDAARVLQDALAERGLQCADLVPLQISERTV